MSQRCTVANYREDRLYPRIVRAVDILLKSGNFVAPVDVLIQMQLLSREQYENWRRGRVPYLERVIECNLSRLGRLLRILRLHAHDLKLEPSWTAYMPWGKGPRQRLRFTKTGDPKLEEAYATHFVRPGKRPFHAAREEGNVTGSGLDPEPRGAASDAVTAAPATNASSRKSESAAMRRAVCSSSGGKDSMLALWHARRAGLQPVTLLTMFDETGLRSRSHGVGRQLLAAQAEALGMALVMPSATWRSYEEVFTRTLTELRASGHEVAVFGDIDLEAHREWEARVCAAAGLEPCLPLWGRDRRELALEAIDLGFRSIVVCVDSRFLSDDYCGRTFDRAFIASLPAGVDPCGENGEFHTFVFDGPGFARPVEFSLRARREYVSPPEYGSQRYCFAELAPADEPHAPAGQ